MLAHGNSRALTVATYNIHKGFSHFNRRMVVHDLRDRLRLMGADVMFLKRLLAITLTTLRIIRTGRTSRSTKAPCFNRSEKLGADIGIEHSRGCHWLC